MERRLIGVALAMLALAGCRLEIDDRSATQLNDDSVAEETVLRTLRSYYDALSRLDSAAFLAHFWPGADVTTIWQAPGADSAMVQVLPVLDFVRQWPEGPGSQPIFEERMDEADVTLRGNLAQAWVRYSARFGDSTDVQQWSGIDAFTLMRHGGIWRIVELAFAPE